MARVDQTGFDRQAETERLLAGGVESGYLTDGRALFHVERTVLDEPSGELLLELEDCATLELIVCSARSLVELGMRPVEPLAPGSG